jgi:hypothetical protein
MNRCKYCKKPVYGSNTEHFCNVKGRVLSSSNDDDFLISMVIGAATDSSLLGGLLGGDMLGGIVGDALDGDLWD